VTTETPNQKFTIQNSKLKIKNPLSPELRFLIACCQTEPSQDDINAIQNTLPAIDYRLLTTMASRHGILPLVYKTLKNLHEKNSLSTIDYRLSTKILAAFKQQYLAIAQRNMLMSAELIRIMKLLEANNIEALAFKGPALSQMAYGDITLRQYGDLDILVDEKDAFQAAKLISENGHTALLPLSILSNRTCLHAAKDFSLRSTQGGVHTELHWRLFEKKYNISLLSCAIDQKCQTVIINTKEIKTLQNELLLVYLCLHGAKHAFERIEWICDIDRLLCSVEINWEEALTIAEQSHSKRSFFLGLSLAHHHLHTALPERIRKSIDTADIKTLHALTLEQMSQKKETRSDFEKNRETFLYQSKLFDHKSDMLRFYLSTFFKISTNDCQTFILPENLKFLYLFLRPMRLISNYTQKIFKNNQNLSLRS
jgi:hypothetical protein